MRMRGPSKHADCVIGMFLVFAAAVTVGAAGVLGRAILGARLVRAMRAYAPPPEVGSLPALIAKPRPVVIDGSLRSDPHLRAG
jgi:hypothetical protein